MNVIGLRILDIAQRIILKGLEKRFGGTGNQKENQDHQDRSTVEIDRNALKNSENLKGLAVTQNSVKTIS